MNYKMDQKFKDFFQDNLKQVEYLTGIKVIATVERGQKDITLLEKFFS